MGWWCYGDDVDYYCDYGYYTELMEAIYGDNYYCDFADDGTWWCVGYEGDMVWWCYGDEYDYYCDYSIEGLEEDTYSCEFYDDGTWFCYGDDGDAWWWCYGDYGYYTEMLSAQGEEVYQMTQAQKIQFDQKRR